jgi:Leucine-rich repeat (LRR) protein
VTEVDNDDDFYAPTLTLAPAYQAPEDFLRDSSFNIGVYHPDPSEKSSAPKPSLHKAHTIGPGGRSSHPSIATLVASAPFEKAPALLLCDNQTDPVPDTPAVVSVAALQHLPLVYAFVRAKGLAPQSGHPVDSILHDVRTQLEIRNSAVRAQNLEAIAATGSSKIRAADTAVIDLEDVTTWDEAEKALRASESVVNLRRMRPVLAQLWPVWMAQYKRFCGKVPDQYVHFKDFAAIPDDALDSAVRWISHEPLVFTGTKEIRFESLPEKLTMIPLCIAELPLTDLEVISFDDNEIRAFPPSCFAKSPKLKWFSIMDNRLTGSIPDTLTEPWREIEVLHFSRNQLTHLPRNLGRGCPRLKTVLFSFNRIAQIPPPLAAVIESLIPLKLKLFDVSHNCLTRDPSLAKLKQVLKTPDSERLPEL